VTKQYELVCKAEISPFARRGPLRVRGATAASPSPVLPIRTAEATGSAIASAFLAVVLLVVRSVLALVRETKQAGRHSTISAYANTISAYAKLNGCGEVRVEVTPSEPTRKARRS
jgi:hypothetical protein